MQACLELFEKIQGQKNSSRKKLKQIIQKIKNLPTKNWFFSQKSPKVIGICTNIYQHLSFSEGRSLKLKKNQGIWGKIFQSFLFNKLKEFSENSRNFLKNSRFRQLELVIVAKKRPKKSLANGKMCLLLRNVPDVIWFLTGSTGVDGFGAGRFRGVFSAAGGTALGGDFLGGEGGAAVAAAAALWLGSDELDLVGSLDTGWACQPS